MSSPPNDLFAIAKTHNRFDQSQPAASSPVVGVL
jgi:hypothetical protein